MMPICDHRSNFPSTTRQWRGAEPKACGLSRFTRVAGSALIVLTLAVSQSASAADQQALQSLLIGSGQFSCGQFKGYQKQNDPGQMNLVVQWFWGFFTAYNWRGGFGPALVDVKQITLPDSPTVLLYVTKFCNDNPLGMIGSAALAMIQDLGGQVFWHPERRQSSKQD